MFGDQEATAKLLWGPPPQAKRGPKPALTVEQIARAAIEVADTDGLAAVSMQRVAEKLDFTKMSLYRYVPGKAEMIAVMIDTAAGDPPVLSSGPGWRPRLEEWAHRLFAMFQPHPWLLDATVGPRIMGPNELGWLESALAELADTGLPGGEQLDAVVTITGHVRAIAQQVRPSPSGNPEEQLSATIVELMRTHGERFPAVTAAMNAVVAAAGQDQALDFGLQRILDGLEQHIAR